MRAGGDFRHHAAERAVLLPLRAHDVRQHPADAVRLAQHHRRGRLVAARLEPEYETWPAGHLRCCLSWVAWAIPRLRSWAGAGINGAASGPLSRPVASTRREWLASSEDPHRHARLALGAGPGAPGGRAPRRRARLAPETMRAGRHQDDGRPDHRSAADRGRRQGSVHQGDRGGAVRRRHRPRRALDEGHAGDLAAGPRHLRHSAARGSARRLRQREVCLARRAAGRRRHRHVVAAPPGAGAARAPRPARRRFSRQRRDAAAQARGGRRRRDLSRLRRSQPAGLCRSTSPRRCRPTSCCRP